MATQYLQPAAQASTGRSARREHAVGVVVWSWCYRLPADASLMVDTKTSSRSSKLTAAVCCPLQPGSGAVLALLDSSHAPVKPSMRHSQGHQAERINVHSSYMLRRSQGRPRRHLTTQEQCAARSRRIRFRQTSAASGWCMHASDKGRAPKACPTSMQECWRINLPLGRRAE